MVQVVRMPMMGNTMETGLVVEWVVTVGEEVEEDDVIAIVESEKASAEVVASQDGMLARIDVEAGEEVPPGTVIGVVLGADESIDAAPSPRSRNEPGQTVQEGDRERAESAESATPTPSESAAETDESDDTAPAEIRAAPGARKLAAEHALDIGSLEATGPEGAVLRADVEEHLERSDESVADESERPELTAGRVFATPSTRRLARELGVSVTEIQGTGTNGLITESDVRAAAGDSHQHSQTTTPAAGETTGRHQRDRRDVDALGVTVSDEQPLSVMRRTIAERLSQSARRAPHVTLNREVSVERAFQAADELSEGSDPPIGFTDVLIAATVRALDGHPRFNAWFEGGQVRLIAERNVAVAVDTDAGLVTPVIREAGTRSLSAIARKRRELTEAVLDGEYSIDNLQGGTFTISNLGMFSVDSFNPIINPPQIAILGVGRVRSGNERTCTLSLSFDHRVVDGADAARFLETITASLEAPTRLIAERAASSADASGGLNRRPRSTASEPTPEDEAQAEPGTSSLGDFVSRDVTEQAHTIASAHDWPTPTFDVQLGEGRPTITVHTTDASSPATLKRLTYAACRESMYADTIAGLRNPNIHLSDEVAATSSGHKH